MEFLSHPVPAVIVLLGVLVFFHELGHYLVGRLSGIAVEVFSIGFGPPLLRWRKGVTEYRLSAIPLGGFVKFYGAVKAEKVPDSVRGQEFYRASWQRRALTVAAGPVANLLLAVVAFAVLGAAGVSHPPPIVGDIRQGSPAQISGIQFLDEIVEINGKPVKVWSDLETGISQSPGQQISLVVMRGGMRQEISLTPAPTEITDILGKRRTVGRAGIALARHPSTVTVDLQGGPGDSAGLQTGDRVAAIQIGDEEVAVKYWREVVNELWRAKQSSQESVFLMVSRPGAATAEKATLKLELQLKDAISAASPEEFVRALGIRDSQLTIKEAQDTLAGVLLPGDVLLAVNEAKVQDVYDLRTQIEALTESSGRITVQRNFQVLDVSVVFKPVEVQAAAGKMTVFTLPASLLSELITPPPVIERYTNPFSALAYGGRETVTQSGEILSALGKMVIGEVPMQAIGGPILIAKVAGESAKRGWETFLSTLAVISINLALINLFPIPVLDGGQLLMIGSEAIRRRPISELAMENFQKVGFVMIMALIVLATYNDFSRFWTSMLESVCGCFSVKHVLTIDTAIQGAFVALHAMDHRGSQTLAYEHHEVVLGSSAALSRMVLDVMDRAGVAVADVSGLMIGSGPGSFTGIKVGLSFAYGMIRGLPSPLPATTWNALRGCAAMLSQSLGGDELTLLLPATKTQGYGASVSADGDVRLYAVELRAGVPYGVELGYPLKAPIFSAVTWAGLDKDSRTLEQSQLTNLLVESAEAHLNARWPNAFGRITEDMPNYMRDAAPIEKRRSL
jgi:regulator of sigma E protease